ncbi:hypothetical protein CI102_14137, partial [Trichoderma harzianum]
SLYIHKIEGKDKFKLMYKKRYKISDGGSSTTKGNINIGFNLTTTFKAQVKVSYRKQTLSISYNTEVSNIGAVRTDLPLAEDLSKLLVNKVPKEFTN